MRNQGNYYDKDKKKKSLEDCACCMGSSKQSSEFEVKTKFIINYVQDNFDSGRDIAEALRTLNDLDTGLWRPTTQVSEAEDEDVRGRENRELEFDDYRECARD